MVSRVANQPASKPEAIVTMNETQEKTKRIMKLMGYEYRHDGITGEWWKGQELFYNEWFKDGDCIAVTILDLYDTGNMALAWEVKRQFLEWSKKEVDKLITKQEVREAMAWDKWHFWRASLSLNHNIRFDELPAAEAQALWLDKVLELAVESGLV